MIYRQVWPSAYYVRSSRRPIDSNFSDCTRSTNNTNISAKLLQYKEKKDCKIVIYTLRLTMVALQLERIQEVSIRCPGTLFYFGWNFSCSENQLSIHREVTHTCSCSSDEDIYNIQTRDIATSTLTRSRCQRCYCETK